LNNEESEKIWGLAAENYDQAAATFEPFAEWLANLCGLRKGMVVLDVGCGTGISSFVAARYVGRRGQVIGIDISKCMVEVAREKPLAAYWPNVQFIVRPAEKTRLADDLFDAVICNFSLHLFDDERAALKEMIRVTRPGGKVGWSVPASDHAREMIDAFARVCKELRLPMSSKGRKPLKPDLERITRLLRFCRISNPEISERKQVFSYTSPESYKRVLKARMGRLLSRVPKERRTEVLQKMFAILLKGKSKFSFTCHAYGVVHEKVEHLA
jgi:ubiquinone/menaquinone biosynthesis C-methylase UbiE